MALKAGPTMHGCAFPRYQFKGCQLNMFQEKKVFGGSIVALAAFLIFTTSAISPLPAQAQAAPPAATHLIISNATSQPVTMYVTLEAPSRYSEDGCTNSCSDLYMVTGGSATQVTSTVTTQAPFTLAKNTTYELISTKVNPYAPGGAAALDCLQGVTVTFKQPPQCPNTGLGIPNGVNQAEPTLNMPGTIGGVTSALAGVGESCDITCLNGANALIQLAITPPSAAIDPQLWTYDVSQTVPASSTFTTENSWVLYAPPGSQNPGCDDNCSPERPAVYPFGCSQCNKFPDPAPPCGQYCASANGLAPNTGCNISRSPNLNNPVGQQYGGTVQYTYMGPAIPPSSCAATPGGYIQSVRVKTYWVKDFNVTYVTKPNGRVVAVKRHPFTSKEITVETIKYHH